MDTFMEHLVARKIRPIQWVLYGAIVLAAVLLVFLTFAIPFVGALVLIGACYGCYFLFKRNFLEFEYIYTNGEMDIDRITGKSRRKRMLTFNMGDVELLAALGDENYRTEFENKNFAKKWDFSSDDPAVQRYFAIMNKKELGKILIVFEPEERMLAAMRAIAPRKVHIA